MKLTQALLHAQDVALCLVRKWWRPIACVGVCLSILNLAIAVLVNGIILPLALSKPLDFQGLGATATGLAALVASLAPFVLARSWEKTKGVAE